MRRSEVPDSEVTTRCDDVLTLLRDGDWHPTSDVASALGVSRQRVYAIVKRLREHGHRIDSEPSIGLHLVFEAPAPSAMVCRYADSETGQVTTVETSVPVCVLPPFAGGGPLTHPPLGARFAEGASMVVGAARSREVRIIEDLDALDDEARGRVLAWATARWASGS
jgi:biotin operon repressor